jgi:hypothetical protein
MPHYRVWTRVGPHEQERVVGAASASDALRVAETRIENLGWNRKDIGPSRSRNEDDPHDCAGHWPIP